MSEYPLTLEQLIAVCLVWLEEKYLKPDITVAEVRQMARDLTVNILRHQEKEKESSHD